MSNIFHKACEFKVIVSEPKINPIPKEQQNTPPAKLQGANGAKRRGNQAKRRLETDETEVATTANTEPEEDRARRHRDVPCFYCDVTSVYMEAGEKKNVLVGGCLDFKSFFNLLW